MTENNNDPCPCCGYCSHCGRRNATPVPVYPWPSTAPYYPYPWWGLYPPNTTSAPVFTGSGNSFTITGVTPGAWTTNSLPPGSLTTS